MTVRDAILVRIARGDSMTRSILADAFDHHVWATLAVLDACAALSDEQLATNVPGTYGSMIDTVRHLVGADRWYLFTLTRGAIGLGLNEAWS